MSKNQTLFGNSRKYLIGKGSNTKKKVELSPPIPSWATTSSQYQSVITNAPINNTKPIEYDEEMLEREKAAQEEIARKKTRVGILYNKGGYGYLGEEPDPEILKGLGKK